MIKIDDKFMAVMCPACGGEGLTSKCDHSEEYKDSFEEHKHELDPCRCCKGLTVVLVPLERITILGSIKKSGDGITAHTMEFDDGSDGEAKPDQDAPGEGKAPE